MDQIKEVLLGIAAIMTALTVILPSWRKLAWKFIVGFGFIFRAPFWMREKMNESVTWQKSIDQRMANVEREGQFNGGSSNKDMLVRLVNLHRHQFRRMQRPAIELDGQGLAHEANDALVRLFRVPGPAGCMNHSWLRFLDPEEVTEFREAFVEIASSGSDFRYAIGIRDLRGDSRGKWEIAAWPVDSGLGSRRVYQAEFAPVDEEAKKVAARNRWSGCACRGENLAD